MKILVDEMPHDPSDCPFYKMGYCNAGPTVRECEYFQMSKDPYYCDWLKVMEVTND